MADRINVTTGTPSGGRSPVGPRAARFVVAGQTQCGPIAPTVVRSMGEFVAQFGVRAGGANVFDAAEFFFANGGGELVVQRAYGPSKVNATVSLDTNKIVVTSRNPGAYYNAATVAYTAASKTVTLVTAAGVTRTYVGTDAATLQAAASVDPDVTVTVSALPAGNVAATNLAGGTDDYANVAWATVLGNITNQVGSGVMAVPGVAAANSALAAAATPRRVAFLSAGQTDAASTVVTSQGSINAAHKQNATFAGPWGLVSDGTPGGRKPLDGVVFHATLRARAITVYGLGASGLMRAAHGLVRGFTPLYEVDDATHTSLVNAGVVWARTLASGVGADVWATAEGVGGNAKLQALQFRDMTNAVADMAARTLDQFVGLPATPVNLMSAKSAVEGVCEQVRPWLVDRGDLDPGYIVAVSPGVDVADGRIQATVSLRFSEEIGFVDLVIIPASADQSI